MKEGRHAAMAEVELAQDAPIVHVRGMDQLFALRRWHGIMERGMWVPGAITAGTFYREGELVFWDVHDPEKTVVIRLRDERHARLVIEVEDPEAVVARVNEATK